MSDKPSGTSADPKDTELREDGLTLDCTGMTHEQVERVLAWHKEHSLQERTQTALDIGKRIEAELAKKALSSRPPKGTRHMTDAEIIASCVLGYISNLTEQLESSKEEL